MKKFIFIFLIICGTASAASLSDALTWKYGECFGTKQADEQDTSINPKMVITNWKCDEKQPTDDEISKITFDYSQSIDYQSKKFDVKNFKKDLYLAFVDDSGKFLKLAPYLALLDELIEYKNFSGIQKLILGLESAGLLEEADAAMIGHVFLINGIDLNKATQ